MVEGIFENGGGGIWEQLQSVQQGIYNPQMGAIVPNYQKWGLFGGLLDTFLTTILIHGKLIVSMTTTVNTY